MKKIIDLSGRIFGNLTVIKISDDYIRGKARWLCKCKCGNTSIIFANNLVRGNTTSCGCHRKANNKIINITHGATATCTDKNKYPSSYKTWCSMKQRCYDKNLPQFKYYGARGIIVCERWHDYSNFVADMGEPPPGKSLDRINNNSSYSPENCRWADSKTQQRNKSNVHLITYQGQTKSLAEWADDLGISRGNLYNRIFRGWDVHQAFTRPYLKSRTIYIANQ